MEAQYFQWAGNPILLELGPLTLRWYGLLFASGFLAGYFITRKLFIQAGKSTELVDSLLTYMLVATIVGARMGHVIFYDLGYYMENPVEILYVWRGGLASHGAVIAILLGLWLYVRRYSETTFFWLTDRLTISVALGGAFIRVGNFFNSEILGTPTDVAWAVVFTAVDDVPRHPAMLYEATLYFLLVGIIWLLYRYYNRQPPEGVLTGWFMIIMFTGRIFLEFTKVRQADFSEAWLLDMGQLLSIPLVLFGIWLLKKAPVIVPETVSHRKKKRRTR